MKALLLILTVGCLAFVSSAAFAGGVCSGLFGSRSSIQIEIAKSTAANSITIASYNGIGLSAGRPESIMSTFSIGESRGVYYGFHIKADGGRIDFQLTQRKYFELVSALLTSSPEMPVEVILNKEQTDIVGLQLSNISQQAKMNDTLKSLFGIDP